MFTYRSVILGMTFVVLLACFCLQVKEHVIKYLGQQTTTSTTQSNDVRLPLPTVALCPGYRPSLSKTMSKMAIDPWPSPNYFDLHPNHQNATNDQITSWWEKEATFDLEEFVQSVFIEHKLGRKEAFDNFESGVDSDVLKVREVSSSFGRCYLFTSPVELIANGGLSITLNMSLLEQDVSFFIFPNGGELGLQGNFWITFSVYRRIQKGGMYDIGLRKEWHKYAGGKTDTKCRTGNYVMADHLNCAMEWSRRAYFGMDCPKVCGVPQADLIIRDMALPMCSNKEEYRCASEAYYNISKLHARGEYTGCRYDCNRELYTANVRQDVTKNRGDLVTIYLYYLTATVTTYTQYMLYDFSAIVSAVGGSLGLFLGFSCWQCILDVARRNCCVTSKTWHNV